ncbi:hypothetical protein PFICI_10424 [Pestalotiopsis fici W106-1]|uniref:JmjC domain-containing protein n=1 Tax=Pestalotiopsis fici (strain W106-1 / CGMCC3.15140) TaxID=1229662 RepID=W3WZ23_PESFW|nr:uncharacterized protein PFICI_10424 [Pestalotiopsis fici W106-1]ETS78362.1 hypothetical protein PFICI_10424 [Pestalotiopsis fici W106-1]
MHGCLLRRSVWQATSSLNALSQFHSGSNCQAKRAISSVSHSENANLDAFRDAAFIPELPLLIRGSHTLTPATKWFTHEQGASASLGTHLTHFHDMLFPYELVQSTGSHRKDPISSFADWLRPEHPDLALHLLNNVFCDTRPSSTLQATFHQFHAPLGLLEQATVYNTTVDDKHRVKRLYIAQSQLNELPQALQDDLSVPAIVKGAGKGDVYDSSIWLGLEPTYTPLHRDPNPNLFVQLLSNKTVRLLKPSLGQQLYTRVQQQLGFRGNSRFRGAEMMSGPERAALYDAIWGVGQSGDILEAVLEPGDALFIPKGWWHSVQSNFDDGRLNASVNWWFR